MAWPPPSAIVTARLPGHRARRIEAAYSGSGDERPTTTKVQTVGRVMHPPPSAAMPPMSTASAVTVWGRGIGQTQVMAAGLAAGLLGMASYRLLTRKNRYVTARG